MPQNLWIIVVTTLKEVPCDLTVSQGSLLDSHCNEHESMGEKPIAKSKLFKELGQKKSVSRALIGWN